MSAARFRFCSGLALAAGLCAAPAGSTAVAQVPPGVAVAQFTLPAAAPAPAMSGLVIQGRYVTAPIVLDGTTLMRIGAPVNPSDTQPAITTRIAEVEAALDQLVAGNGSGPKARTIFDPRTLRVKLKHEGAVTVLEAVDGKHEDALAIVTVTDIDARCNGTDIDTLAAQWQGTLQSALVRALDLRQPLFEERSRERITVVALVLSAVTLLVVVLLRILGRRRELLEASIDQRALAAADGAPAATETPAGGPARRRFLALSLRNLEPARRLMLYGATAETLVWGVFLAWFIAATWALGLFAQTTPLARDLTRSALGVTATILVAGFLNRVLDIVITRTATAWRPRGLSYSEDRERLVLRIPTIARTVAGAKTFVLVFFAGLSVIGQIGVPIASVVTIGGLTAIALSLAAQNFVRDFLNGFLVLYEDQYVVGDYVTINTHSGSVELLTLRMVQIRDTAGDLITIPHSSVVNVVNQSRNWSRVDYRVAVDPAADVPQAIDIVRAAIEALAAEGNWTHGVVAPLEWIGIEALSKNGVVLRASVKTAPLRQFEVRRQINERVRTAFLQAGIALGAAPFPAL